MSALGRQALAEQVNEASALFRLTDRLYRARSDRDVYDAALDAITETLGCARASILLFDNAGVMRFVAARGLSDYYRKTLEGHTPWKPGERDPQPIFVSDIDDTGEADWVKAAIRKENIRSLAFIPLVAQGGVVGKFMTYYEAPRAFDDHEIGLAVTIARQVGFSIERSRAEQAREAAERRRELLVAELNHRVKNTLSVVQAMAHQTFRGTAEEPRAAFDGRLVALARAHDLLTHSNWDSVLLQEVAAAALQMQDTAEPRVTFQGPAVQLAPRQALAVGMVLHELFTNALKYGALSNASGTVALNWRHPDGAKARLDIEWRETDGPPVTAPLRTGFGSVLLERTVTSDLDGEVHLDFQPNGLVCTIGALLHPKNA